MGEHEIIAWLASDSGLRVHVTIFSMLVMGGLGLPIPEDLPILFAGVAVANNIVALSRVFITCYAGVIVADQMVYAFGYFFGNRLLDAGARSPFFPSITEERINEIREGLRRKRFVYIFIGRHLFPLRTATFITAGALRIPFVDFLVADMIAAFVSITAMMLIGYTIGQRISPEVLAHVAHQFQWYLTGIIIIGAALYGVKHYRKKRKHRRHKK